MAAVEQNFELDAGDSKFIDIIVYKKQTDSNGNVVIDPGTNQPVLVIDDITGTTEIEWILRRNETDTTDLITKLMSTGGISLSNPTQGMFTVTLNPTDTQGYKYNYFHKAKITDAQGNVSTVTKGTIRVNP